MKKFLKIFSIILLVMLVVLQYAVISNAADVDEKNKSEQTKISLKIKDNKIKLDSEIKVYIYLESTKFTDGIALVEGKIEYDAEKLEPITTNDSTYNGWNTTWNTENGKITIDRGNLTATPQEIAELTFKVKENVKKGETSITFSEISVSDGFEDETIEESVNLKLEITDKNNSEPEEPKDPEEPGNNNNEKEDPDKNNGNSDKPSNGDNNSGSDNNNGGNNSSDDKKEESKPTVNNNAGSGSSSKKPATNAQSGSSNVKNGTASGTLPKTGISQWIVGTAIVVIAIGIVSYIKYKKYRNI